MPRVLIPAQEPLTETPTCFYVSVIKGPPPQSVFVRHGLEDPR